MPKHLRVQNYLRSFTNSLGPLIVGGPQLNDLCELAAKLIQVAIYFAPQKLPYLQLRENATLRMVKRRSIGLRRKDLLQRAMCKPPPLRSARDSPIEILIKELARVRRKTEIVSRRFSVELPPGREEWCERCSLSSKRAEHLLLSRVITQTEKIPNVNRVGSRQKFVRRQVSSSTVIGGEFTQAERSRSRGLVVNVRSNAASKGDGIMVGMTTLVCMGHDQIGFNLFKNLQQSRGQIAQPKANSLIDKLETDD